MLPSRTRPWSKRFHSLAGLAIALFAGAGCAYRETVTVHGEPVVRAESEELLVVQVAPLDDGGMSLRAWRERDRVIEVEYWKMELGSAGEPDGLAVAGLGSENKEALSSFFSALMSGGGSRSSTSPGDRAPGASESNLFRAIGQSFRRSFDHFGKGVASIFGVEIQPPAVEQRVTVRSKEVARALSPSIFLRRVEGRGLVALGPQPTEGYRIDKADIERLGGPGARVWVTDGSLETEITLSSPR